MILTTGKKHLFKRVAIIGVGLIGGSLGLAINSRGLAGEVLGIGRSENTLELAAECGAINSSSTKPDAVAGADLIVLATPVGATVEVLRAVVPYITPGTLLTDVGSTKTGVIKGIREILPEHSFFIGGHPMAGSERAGISGADPYLFENAFYMITPDENSRDEDLRRLRELVEGIGAKPVIMFPVKHDLSVAAVSHLPHLLAASLVNFLFDLPEGEEISPLAAGGFRDTTRIAAGDPVMWRDIFLSNREAILGLLEKFRTNINNLSQAIDSADGEEIYRLLDRARKLKLGMPARTKGYLPMLWEIVVTVPDSPGMISEIAGLLGRNGINIVDIEIMRVREGEGGTIRLGFATEDEQSGAVEILRSSGYIVIKR